MKQMLKKHRILSLLLLVALLAAIALSGTACDDATGGQTDTSETAPAPTDSGSESQSESQTTVDPSVLGSGATQFTVQVTYKDGSTESFTVRTDKTNVGDALIEVQLIAGEDSSYGWFITTVDGEYHKYEQDGKYWAFYIDGEYAMTGVSSTPVTAGATYAFKVE